MYGIQLGYLIYLGIFKGNIFKMFARANKGAPRGAQIVTSSEPSFKISASDFLISPV